MIEFENVRLAYGEHVVLDDLSFRASPHEKIAILGGSGSGKTTILRLMLGLVRPDSGRILIEDRDITTMKENQLRDVRTKFCIVFQEGALFDSLDVGENVAYRMREYADMPEEEIDRNVRKILSRLGIEDAIQLMPEELSGGMQRRAAIARSLASGTPEMMLYDEPTTGLDPITADNICGLINELSGGEAETKTGLIIVTHKVIDAAKVAERFLYLKKKIVFDGNIEELKGTGDPELRQFINELIHGL